MNKYICTRELIFYLSRDVSLGFLCSNSLISSATPTSRNLTSAPRGCKIVCKRFFFSSTTARRVTSPTWGPPPPCERALYVNQGKRSVTRHRQNTKKLYPTDCLFKAASHWFHRNVVRFITNKSIFHRISPLYVCAF